MTLPTRPEDGTEYNEGWNDAVYAVLNALESKRKADLEQMISDWQAARRKRMNGGG